MGGLGATILLLGSPKHLFRPLLDLSWAPLVAPGSLWAPFGTHYGASKRTSRCAGLPSKVWVLAHLGTARMPLYSSGGVSGAHSASCWALWNTPDAPLGTSSALLERARCNFGVFLTYLAFGHVCAPGKGAQCAFRTCRRMLRKGSPNPRRLTFEITLGPK